MYLEGIYLFLMKTIIHDLLTTKVASFLSIEGSKMKRVRSPSGAVAGSDHYEGRQVVWDRAEGTSSKKNEGCGLYKAYLPLKKSQIFSVNNLNIFYKMSDIFCTNL